MRAQPVTEETAIQNALEQYPGLQIADQQLRMQEALQKSAFNPVQPQLTFEFPNDVGIAFELQQQFDFPGLYLSRAQWLEAQTQQQVEMSKIIRSELIRDVRLSYLEAQAAQAIVQILHQQDSLWQNLAQSAQRLYDAGEINKADVLFTYRQKGIVSTRLAQAQVESVNARTMLGQYAGMTISDVAPLRKLPVPLIDSAQQFYFEQYFTEVNNVASLALKVERAERLPGLIVGYLRVPEIDTDYRSRFSAGFTIPIWQGQYQSQVDAAKIAQNLVQTQYTLQQQQAQSSRQSLYQTLLQTDDALHWFEQTALSQSDELITTYQRLFEGGETDYTLALRNITDALDIYMEYIDTLTRHNRTIIALDFLHSR
jgi:cobalt-zinc-cadmium resistance protein CzcA